MEAMDSGSQQEIRIIDKDESSDQAFNVVGGFVIEDSKTPFPVILSPSADPTIPSLL